MIRRPSDGERSSTPHSIDPNGRKTKTRDSLPSSTHIVASNRPSATGPSLPLPPRRHRHPRCRATRRTSASTARGTKSQSSTALARLFRFATASCSSSSSRMAPSPPPSLALDPCVRTCIAPSSRHSPRGHPPAAAAPATMATRPLSCASRRRGQGPALLAAYPTRRATMSAVASTRAWISLAPRHLGNRLHSSRHLASRAVQHTGMQCSNLRGHLLASPRP